VLNRPIPALISARRTLHISKSRALELSVPDPLPLADPPLEVPHTRVGPYANLVVVPPAVQAKDGFAYGGGAAEPLAGGAGGEIDLLGEGAAEGA